MYNITNNIDTNLNISLIGANKASIISLINKWFNNEYISGYSCKQYTLKQYYLAFILAKLILQEMTITGNSDYEYYNLKYNINKKKQNLACNKIDLDNIFTLTGVLFTSNSGVGGYPIGGFPIGNIPTVSTFPIYSTPYCSLIIN